MTMSAFQTFSATEFKAKCLDILDRLASHELQEVKVTKRGKTVAVLHPPQDQAAQPSEFYGFMQGSVRVPADVDLTAPILDEVPLAALGKLE
jgi:antitoxin (DNA-binding transcriptional repressor) of toxin-antitoxin stability system